MKILILGVNGMAGHVLYQYFRSLGTHQVWGTSRTTDQEDTIVPLDILDMSSVERTIKRIKPDVVVNAIGLLNENAAEHVQEAIYVNALFPHTLAEMGRYRGFKVVHISTDCVFSGMYGNYRESDIADGCSVYAKTKSLGEIIDHDNLTIRTSIVGPETKQNGIGLFHWFCHQTGTIRGYSEVYWNGVTTLELSKAIQWSLEHGTTGLVHLATNHKISKYDLLNMFKRTFERNDIVIIPDSEPRSDKSLLNTRDDFAYPVQPYPQMIREMKDWMDRAATVYNYRFGS